MRVLLFFLGCIFHSSEGRICSSCTNLQEGELCPHVVNCQHDQVCFIQKYTTPRNQTRYDVGCTYPELCRKEFTFPVLGKRDSHAHVLCQECCDSEHICNSNTTCSSAQRQPLQCMACAGLQDPTRCNVSTICDPKEVCYLHKYVTESGFISYDLGCKHFTLCSMGNIDIFGKRSSKEGRQLVCETCCSGDGCNSFQQCDHHSYKGLNGSCNHSNECHKDLFCLAGKCICPQDQYFWNGHECLLRLGINSTCSESKQCQYSLTCINNKCVCYPSNTSVWQGNYCQVRARECEDLPYTESGVYTIYPDSVAVKVYCMVDERGKWTVIQRRNQRRVQFNVNWQAYKIGFGNVSGEYWLGNENINLITTNGKHELSIYLRSSYDGVKYANYSDFELADEANQYRLRIGQYKGDAGNQMDTHNEGTANGQFFSTRDRDNDGYDDGDCSHGACDDSGWWMYKCRYACLNQNSELYWSGVAGLQESIMMIKRST